MSAWDAYPSNYREIETDQILACARAGDSCAVVGLSGAGKSNLLGFLAYHRSSADLALVLVDGNRARSKTADGLLFEAARAFKSAEQANPDPLEGLQQAVERQQRTFSGPLCLLFDCFDALPEAEREALAGPLRALRDAFKYRLAFVTATRRPLNSLSEMAELFYAHTLWLGPLARPDAAWSAWQFARRRGLRWLEADVNRLIEISWGYPSLLRGCCEAYADGCLLEEQALLNHPAVQRRVEEFWADRPTPDDLRRSKLDHQPLLKANSPSISASSPELTTLEARLLAFLQAHADEICVKDDLIRAVWPEDRVLDGLRDDSLAQLIRRLRQKIEPDPTHPRRLLTAPGRGYRLAG